MTALERLKEINPNMKVSLDTASQLINMEARWNQKVGRDSSTILDVVEKLLPSTCKEFKIKVLVREFYYYPENENTCLLFACKKCVFIYDYEDTVAKVIFFG